MRKEVLVLGVLVTIVITALCANIFANLMKRNVDWHIKIFRDPSRTTTNVVAISKSIAGPFTEEKNFAEEQQIIYIVKGEEFNFNPPFQDVTLWSDPQYNKDAFDEPSWKSIAMNFMTEENGRFTVYSSSESDIFTFIAKKIGNYSIKFIDTTFKPKFERKPTIKLNISVVPPNEEK